MNTIFVDLMIRINCYDLIYFFTVRKFDTVFIVYDRRSTGN